MSNLTKALNRWKEVIFITFSIRLLLLILSEIINYNKGLNPLYYWIQWDGPHYIDLAKNWYQTNGEQALWIVFYPLYPILINIFNLFINDFSSSIIIVSIIFSFTASIYLYELVLLDLNKKIAILSVWFLNIFPTSYFLQSSYTESVYLTTSLACIYYFRKGLIFKSTIAGILTTMTRINGILLLPLLFMESKKNKYFITLLFLPFGFLFYLWINYITFGDFFYFTKPLEFNWYKSFDLPWNGILYLIHSLPPPNHHLAYAYYTEFAFIILILAVGLYTFFKIRRSYGIYMFLNFLLFTSTSYVISTPRYALILFPIYITLGKIKNPYLLATISIISSLLLLYFSSLYIRGQWTF